MHELGAVLRSGSGGLLLVGQGTPLPCFAGLHFAVLRIEPVTIAAVMHRQLSHLIAFEAEQLLCWRLVMLRCSCFASSKCRRVAMHVVTTRLQPQLLAGIYAAACQQH
jgi:hypothetical protein